MKKSNLYEKFIKRFLDIILSGMLILLLSPIFIILALLVKRKLGSPVIFCQLRPGKNERIFKMYKFKTMTNELDDSGNLLPDHMRITKFGSLLRSLSLDELPELWNIFKGDMSLVGPRPLLVEYLPLYNEKQRQRHIVRPGLTGLAQVSGRNLVSWEDKFFMDYKYVNNITFAQDFQIIILTIKKVLIREGISSSNHVTNEKFKGNGTSEINRLDLERKKNEFV
ncbi:sugar transferase [Enterococcus innesii]|uniref:sugar transferase n=1 Tax=Enterococcus TaxID=1350 RepID=UPI003DA44E57